jgi:hypothetical protein
MSFSSVPVEIKNKIVNFIQPTRITYQEVQKCGRTIEALATTCKELKELSEKQLKSLKKIQELIIKYPTYNQAYEYAYQYRRSLRDGYPGGNPQLLDALFTGCKLPYARSQFNEYHQEIENDIKEIVVLTPQSMTCTIGILKCTKYVPPLAAACFNESIPLHIVEFLLEKGANPNATYDLDGQPIDILSDIKINISPERFAAIEVLFNKYRAH